MKNSRWIACISACAMLLSGCGSKSALNANKPVSITVWNYYTGAQLEQFNTMVKEFNAQKGKELGIVVNSFSEGNISDLSESISSAAKKEVGAGKMPNIFAAYADTAFRIDQNDLLVDLNPYITDKEKAEYIDSYIEEGDLHQNGELKLFPIAKATEILMINKTDWDKFAKDCGVSEDDLATMEGVSHVAKLYYDWTDAKTEMPNDGKAFFGRDAMANYMITGSKQLGHDLIAPNKDNKIVIDFPEDVARKLWEQYYIPYIHGYFSAEGRFRSDDVKTGYAIACVGSSSSATFFPSEVILSDTEKYPIEIEVLKAPIFEGGEPYATQQGAGMAVVKASEAEIEASVAFLKWFTQKEQNIEFSLASGYLPVKKEANEMSVIDQFSDISEDVRMSLEASLDTIHDSKMYVSRRSDGELRDVLEHSMSDRASQDRAQIKEAIEEGASYEEAIAPYETDERFQSWYKSISTELQHVAASVNMTGNATADGEKSE